MKKKIFIPHIFYTVNVKDVKEAKGRIKTFLSNGYVACCENVDKNTSDIYITYPIKNYYVPTIVHELTHVLQNICRERNMVFEDERENTAYMLHFMLNEILGYEYS